MEGDRSERPSEDLFHEQVYQTQRHRAVDRWPCGEEDRQAQVVDGPWYCLVRVIASGNSSLDVQSLCNGCGYNRHRGRKFSSDNRWHCEGNNVGLTKVVAACIAKSDPFLSNRDGSAARPYRQSYIRHLRILLPSQVRQNCSGHSCRGCSQSKLTHSYPSVNLASA